MTEPVPTPTDDPASRLPRHTTPTWEVELLISGVAVFAMLQLPGWLDDSLFALQPRFGAGWEMPLLLVYLYLKSATVILAVTFALHLLLRAQWIAIVGMHSVFPDGIRWDQLRMGPVRREMEMRHYGSAAVSTDRADNRATIVFSIGVMLASNLLLIIVLFVAAFALALLVAKFLGLGADVGALFVYCVILLMLPALVLNLIDRRFGARLRAGGTARRGLAAVLGFYSRTGLMSRSSNPVLSLLSSHGGERLAMALMMVVIALVSAGVMLGVNSMQDPARLGSYSMFPVFSDGSRTIDGAHYDDQRGPARDGATPFIQSAVVVGPYLRLVVPYQPDGDTNALRRSCPDASALAGDARATALLACLQRVHAVAIDGKPLPSPPYELGADARTDRPALVAMIDARALAPGRHELEVARAPEGGDKEDAAGKRWRIPFWR